MIDERISSKSEEDIKNHARLVNGAGRLVIAGAPANIRGIREAKDKLPTPDDRVGMPGYDSAQREAIEPSSEPELPSAS